MPFPVRLLLVGGALVPIGSMLLLGVNDRRLHALMVISVAIFIAYAQFLVMILDHPFSGTVSVSRAPYHVGLLERFAR